jgi:6-pyruvoyltetrahydropterin/6-carboxytetrahydropterin synthase
MGGRDGRRCFVIAVTRRYRFPAAHVLRSDAFTDADNERIYGKCANPAGHGHDYGLEVTVAGPVDARTGAIFPLDRLDALVRERVLDRLSHRLLNDDAWFATAVPTAENIAEAIERELRAAVAAESRGRLVRVRLLETRRNYFACGEAEG